MGQVSVALQRRQAEEASRRAYDELETQVEKRTGDPASSNEALRAEIAQRLQMEEALRESERESRQLAHENAAMADMGRVINSSLDIDEVYQWFAEEVRKLVGRC